MNITLCSSFRSSVPYLPRYLSQVADLDTLLYHAGYKLSFIWAEGDSTDGTQKMLTAARWRFKSTIVGATHGGPVYESIVSVKRFAQLAYVANKVWELLPADASVVIWAESDLIWEPAMMLRLIARLQEVPVVSPMIMDSPPANTFYDTFCFRRNGVQFAKQPPYHADFADLMSDAPGGLLEMDSVGSIVVMRGDVARAVYVPIEDVLLGTCRMIRELGHKIYLDTGAKCLHP